MVFENVAATGTTAWSASRAIGRIADCMALVGNTPPMLAHKYEPLFRAGDEMAKEYEAKKAEEKKQAALEKEDPERAKREAQNAKNHEANRAHKAQLAKAEDDDPQTKEKREKLPLSSAVMVLLASVCEYHALFNPSDEKWDLAWGAMLEGFRAAKRKAVTGVFWAFVRNMANKRSIYDALLGFVQIVSGLTLVYQLTCGSYSRRKPTAATRRLSFTPFVATSVRWVLGCGLAFGLRCWVFGCLGGGWVFLGVGCWCWGCRARVQTPPPSDPPPLYRPSPRPRPTASGKAPAKPSST